jgi:hypothetical protein
MGSGLNFSFTPQDNDTFTVTFHVEDDDGGEDSTNVMLTSLNVPPTADAGTNQTVDEGEQADFTGTFTDPGVEDTHTTAWEVVNSSGSTVATGSGSSISYTPDDNDTYTVTFTVTDDDNGVGSDSVLLMSLNVAPTVDAGADQMALAGQVVTFTGTFSDPGTADTHTFLWEVESSNGQNIPDGTDQAINFTPNAAGTYTLTFTVTDDDNGVGVDSAVLVVEEDEEEVYVLYMPVVHKELGRDDLEIQLPEWAFLLPGLVLGIGFGRRRRS